MPRTQAIALIVVALVLGFVIGHKSGKGSVPPPDGAVSPSAPPPVSADTRTPTVSAPGADTTAPDAALPRLVDLGSTTCIPCKQMAPILEELKQEYRGKVAVEFIDVNVNVAAADEYKISVIPTQVFIDRDGKEVFRHEGFFPKADILAQFEKMGIQTK